jgi:hypothetical protein
VPGPASFGRLKPALGPLKVMALPGCTPPSLARGLNYREIARSWWVGKARRRGDGDEDAEEPATAKEGPCYRASQEDPALLGLLAIARLVCR